MQNQMVVLVVEDDAILGDILAAFVSSLPNTLALQAHNFDTAKAALKATPRVDLLLCDLFLAETYKGIAVADLAKRLHPRISVALLSADYEEDVGAFNPSYALMAKPFDRQELLTRIDAAFLALRQRAR
jgi:DNA-binding NtrC family response regulator